MQVEQLAGATGVFDQFVATGADAANAVAIGQIQLLACGRLVLAAKRGGEAMRKKHAGRPAKLTAEREQQLRDEYARRAAARKAEGRSLHGLYKEVADDLAPDFSPNHIRETIRGKRGKGKKR